MFTLNQYLMSNNESTPILLPTDSPSSSEAGTGTLLIKNWFGSPLALMVQVRSDPLSPLCITPSRHVGRGMKGVGGVKIESGDSDKSGR